MNPQKPDNVNAIHWTRIRNADGTRRPGYTWNPMAGCLHDCRWEMPDGQMAECYAKDVAEGLARAAYPMGFAHHYFHPDRLDDPLRMKIPSGIFLDSMGDLMGGWVPSDDIEKVISICAQARQHVFLLLTKNAPRLRGFLFPNNMWVGVSSSPDWMMGSRIKHPARMLDSILRALKRVRSGRWRWVSFEPLSFDASPVVRAWPNLLDWAVIGAASNGRTKYPPDEGHLRALVEDIFATMVLL
jgi:protein gp37